MQNEFKIKRKESFGILKCKQKLEIYCKLKEGNTFKGNINENRVKVTRPHHKTMRSNKLNEPPYKSLAQHYVHFCIEFLLHELN